MLLQLEDIEGDKQVDLSKAYRFPCLLPIPIVWPCERSWTMQEVERINYTVVTVSESTDGNQIKTKVRNKQNIVRSKIRRQDNRPNTTDRDIISIWKGDEGVGDRIGMSEQ